ncbi:MAG: 2'-5' RNA ligase family protein [Anaerolineaceae bacterium]
MGFAVELYFDEHSDQAIRKMWAAAGSSLPAMNADPHISLSLHADVDTARMDTLLREFAARTPCLTVSFPALASFLSPEGVIYLAPTVTEPLLNLHKAFHQALDKAGIPSHPYYRPGGWMPHCTVDMNLKPNDLQRKFSICREFPPLTGVVVVSIGLISYQPVVDLFRHPLKAVD